MASPSDNDDDPEKLYDWIMLVAVIVFSVPFIAANGAMIFHRKKNYFRALGGVDLVVATSAAGLVWIAANFVTNEHFSRRGLMSFCWLWTFWLQLPLGCCLWMILLVLRLHRLYVLSTKDRLVSWIKTWFIYLPMLLLPVVIFSIAGTITHASAPRSPPPGPPPKGEDRREPPVNCQITEYWKYATYLTVPPFYISLIILFLLYLRKQTDFLLMSECRHTCESTMMAFMFYLLDAVIFISEKQKNVAGRCFLTFCVCWLVFMDFWVRMTKPVYLCFRPKPEMEKFEDELRWCGASFFDKVRVASVLRYTRTSSIPSSQLHDGDWILRTMDLLFSETEERKERIQLLEQQKSRLALKVKELEESLGILGSSSTESGSQSFI